MIIFLEDACSNCQNDLKMISDFRKNIILYDNFIALYNLVHRHDLCRIRDFEKDYLRPQMRVPGANSHP